MTFLHPLKTQRNPNITQLVFIEENDKKTGLLDPDRLDVLIFHDLQNIQNIDTLKIFVTRNLPIKPTIFNDDSAFLGFGVNEIVTPVGYTFANGIHELFHPSDPTYPLKRNHEFNDGRVSLYEGNDNDVKLSLIFSYNARKEIEATLIHEFPQIVHQPEFTAPVYQRNFKLIGIERGRKLEDIKLI